MNTKQTVMKMNEETPNYQCIHEELLQNHSLKITGIEKELNYKKEKLDDLKEQKEKMQDTLEEIRKDINKIMLKSKDGDTELNQRIIKLENENKTLQQEINEIKTTQEKNTDRQYTKIALLISAIAIIVSIITHFT